VPDPALPDELDVPGAPPPLEELELVVIFADPLPPQDARPTTVAMHAVAVR
jgi:hypothetical protein